MYSPNWPLRVVDKIENQLVIRTVTEGIQPLESADALVVHAFAALAVDQLLGVARQGRDHLDLPGGEELCEVRLARLLEDRQVAAVDDLHSQLPRAHHQLPEMGIQLRGSAGDVKDPDRRHADARDDV